MVPGATQSDYPADYFVFAFPLSADAWDRYAIDALLPPGLVAAPADPAWEIRRLAERLLRERADGPPAEILLALRTLNQALRYVAVRYFRFDNPGSLDRGRQWAAGRLGEDRRGQRAGRLRRSVPAARRARRAPRCARIPEDRPAPAEGPAIWPVSSCCCCT